MKFFKPWTWFQSEERELKKEQLRLEIENLKLQQKLLYRELGEEGDNPTALLVSDRVEPSPTEAGLADINVPYKSLRIVDDTVIVTTLDGDVFTKENVDINFYLNIKKCNTEQEMLLYFLPKLTSEGGTTVPVETPEEVRIVEKAVDVLAFNKDFTKKGSQYFMVGVDLPMPASVYGTFAEIEEKKLLNKDNPTELETLNEAYEALKMFWYWTALNPIESSRNDLLAFVKKHDINITKNGLLEMYRKIVKINDETDSLKTESISNNYAKVKSWKKSPANYYLIRDVNGEYTEMRIDKVKDEEVIGNLKELYSNLSSMEENRYTDNHTKTKDIRIGQIYREDEDNIDLDNRRDCSTGLHVGSHEFGFSGFGNTGVMALVNPAKVRSVPVSDTNKMRVSEMFIAAEMKIEDYKKSVLKGEIKDFSQEYFNQSVEELAKAVKDKNFNKVFACKNQKTPLNDANIANIKNMLSEKVVEI